MILVLTRKKMLYKNLDIACYKSSHLYFSPDIAPVGPIFNIFSYAVYGLRIEPLQLSMSQAFKEIIYSIIVSLCVGMRYNPRKSIYTFFL